MLNIHFTKLIEPTIEIAEAFNRWENDPDLIPLTRPNANKGELEKRQVITLDDLTQRLKHHHIYLIH